MGSTLGLTDSNGAFQTTYTYEPFGNTTSFGAASSNPYQYTGRENDATGLYFYRARHYSPTFQRFVSEDPLGFNGGINLYAYVGNNPVNFFDPFGLKPRSQGPPTKKVPPEEPPKPPRPPVKPPPKPPVSPPPNPDNFSPNTCFWLNAGSVYLGVAAIPAAASPAGPVLVAGAIALWGISFVGGCF